MRIAVNGWFAGQLATGTGQYLAGLAAWLPQLGPEHELILVLPARRWSEAHGFQADVPGWQITVAGTPMDRINRNLAKVWFEQVAFPCAVRRCGAQLALVPYWGSPWWSPCPCLVTVHDIIPLLLPEYRGGLAQQAYSWLVARTARRAGAVLTDSEASRRDIIARLGIAPERVYAVHLAVDAAFRPVGDASRLDAVRARYRLPAAPFWLYLGGFDARKNLSRLLAAYARLRHECGPAQVPLLVVAGRPPGVNTAFAPDPRVIAARLGISEAVHLIGWVDEADKPALYTLAQAAFFVSTYEGFGLPVLEAQACGCPVITST